MLTKTKETLEDKPEDTPGTASTTTLKETLVTTLTAHELAGKDNPVLLMVSGGSDSTALAYLAAELRDEGMIGPLAMLHVNHQLRGEDADADARFAGDLAALLNIPFFLCEVDVAGEAARAHDNIEAVARRERYLAAHEALTSMCQHEGYPLVDARIFTAHTLDDRIENFYMRSIVGTGPGGFRSMLYRNGPVVRPLLDVTRQDLRDYLVQREHEGRSMVCDAQGDLWREDATNAHTDRFRAYVRAEIVPKAKEWNEAMPKTLARTMNLIAEEDDMLQAMAQEHWDDQVERFAEDGSCADGFLLTPAIGELPLPLQRRVLLIGLKALLGAEERIDTATVEAILAGYEQGKPKSGYVTNVQGDLAVSANKQGVRVEPMAIFRARRKKN